jgi:predicted RNase H-like HicB family nuclease
MKHKVSAGKKASYTVVFERNEEGGFTVTVPILPGLVTEGRTLKEARAMAEDAILCYLEGLRKDGEPIPVESEVDVEKLEVVVPAA